MIKYKQLNKNDIVESVNISNVLFEIYKDTCEFISENINWKISEHDILQFILGKYNDYDLVSKKIPRIAFNENNAISSYIPNINNSKIIRRSGLLSITYMVSNKDSDNFGSLSKLVKINCPFNERQQACINALIDTEKSIIGYLEEIIETNKKITGTDIHKKINEFLIKKNLSNYKLENSIQANATKTLNKINFDNSFSDNHLIMSPSILIIDPKIYFENFLFHNNINLIFSKNSIDIITKDPYKIGKIQL